MPVFVEFPRPRKHASAEKKRPPKGAQYAGATPAEIAFFCMRRAAKTLSRYIHPISPNTMRSRTSTPNMTPSVMSLFFIFFMSCTINAIVKNGR